MVEEPLIEGNANVPCQCVNMAGIQRKGPLSKQVADSSRGGVLTYLAKQGCAALMGRFFYKKSLNMGPKLRFF